MTGFASPTAALAQIVECLDGLCARVHVGSRDSGLTIECDCGRDAGCLLRVEDGGVHVASGARSLAMVGKCLPLVMDVIVVYRVCFASSTPTGRERSIADLTADGTAITLSWMDALTRLSECRPWNQNMRLIQVLTDSPEGNCAGWTMNLEADLSICR